MTLEQLLRQQREARKMMLKLEKLYPGAFRDGKPIVATLRLPGAKHEPR